MQQCTITIKSVVANDAAYAKLLVQLFHDPRVHSIEYTGKTLKLFTRLRELGVPELARWGTTVSKYAARTRVSV